MSQYWIQSRGEIRGPFSAAELSAMGKARKLRPDDKVSIDRKEWKVTSRVPGLLQIQRDSASEESATDKSPSASPAPIAGDEEYELQPPAEVIKPQPALQRVEDEVPPLPVGSQHRIVVPHRQTAGVVSLMIAALLFFGSIPLAIFADEAWAGGQALGLTMGLFMLATLLWGAVMVSIAVYGSKNSIFVEVRPAGRALVRMTRHIAFVNIMRHDVLVGAGDSLQKRIRYDGTMQTPSFEHRTVKLVRTFYTGEDDDRQSIYQFQLVLVTRAANPVVLFQDGVEDYHATRFGTPRLAEEIVLLLRGAVPRIRIRELES